MTRNSFRCALLALLLLLSLPSVSSALDFSLFAGYWDTDQAGSSIGYGARLAFLKTIQIEIGAAYYDDLERRFEAGAAFDVKAIPVDIGARLPLGRSAYFGVGGSVFFLDSDLGTLDDEFGYYGALGFSGRKFFVEARYRSAEGTVKNLTDPEEGIDFESDELDVDLSGWEFILGFKF